jgi:DNA-binding LacI/PurR family transcriptional regulator
MPSIRTVASRAGVSTATVSNVLNARRSVAPDLAARVQSAVAELGYIADLGASRLRSRKSAIAGVLVPDIANPFFGSFVGTLETAARRDGYDLLIVSSGGDPVQEATRLRALLTWRPAGVIVIPCDDTLAARAVAQAAGVPMVAADRVPGGEPIDLVAVDNRAIAGEVARHLLEGGRRHILVAAAHMAISNNQERVEGIRAVVQPEGATAEVLEVGFTVAESRARIAARLATSPRPDALFTLNNLATLGALDALAFAGLVVPRDLALAGFDDEPWMHVVSPPLTAVRQPVARMALAAWGRLMARIGGDTAPAQQVRLPCSLEIRASSAAAVRRPLTAMAAG